MKLLVLTTHNDGSFEQSKRLRDSLIKHGYDFEEFIYGHIFGQQYDIILKYINQYQGEATHILYTDAFDTIAFATPSEVIKKFKQSNCKMLISAEKACFPYVDKAVLYPQSPTVWKYINGGGCLFEIEYFKDLCNKYPFAPDYIDPDWLMNCFLENQDNIKLDYICNIFQPIAHSDPSEWAWNPTEKRWRNIATNTKPVFFHGNGRTNMEWLTQ